MKKGKFIVIYGANNLGKSLQLEMLESALRKKGLQVKRIKYPIYNLEPTGPLINSVLRKGLKMPDDEFHKLYAQNRFDFEPELKEILNSGVWVVAEDYVGTDYAWGMVHGLPLKFLRKINKGLYPEDLCILIYGERFHSGKEKNHKNESDDSVWNMAQKKHLILADKLKWHKVYANQTPAKVHKDIIEVLKKNESL